MKESMETTAEVAAARAAGEAGDAGVVLVTVRNSGRLNAMSRAMWRQLLLQCAAHYLARELVDGKPVDPVARFHLGNGARVERLNWAGDPSAKGHKQSYGLMVNYLYDLKRIDKHRSLLAEGKVAASREIESLSALR